MNNVRLKQKEKQNIVNRATNYIINQNLDVEIAVEDAVVEVVPRSLKQNEAGDNYVAVSESVLHEIKAEVETKVTERRNVQEETREVAEEPRQELQRCLCGCGQVVNKGKKFRQGHDARLLSILKRVEKGEADENEIPEEAREQLVPCACCGKLIIPHDSGKGPVCRDGRCKCVKIKGGNQ